LFLETASLLAAHPLAIFLERVVHVLRIDVVGLQRRAHEIAGDLDALVGHNPQVVLGAVVPLAVRTDHPVAFGQGVAQLARGAEVGARLPIRLRRRRRSSSLLSAQA
jgi:hypothetical protein